MNPAKLRLEKIGGCFMNCLFGVQEPSGFDPQLVSNTVCMNAPKGVPAGTEHSVAVCAWLRHFRANSHSMFGAAELAVRPEKNDILA